MKKILIVDDNTNNRMFLRLLCEEYAKGREGVEFELAEAENGKEAVALASSNAFDLILMDIMMPEMDGTEATRQIRRQNREVMIIAVSAIDEEARKKEILNAGAEDYITKPVNTDHFLRRMDIYLLLVDSRRHSVHNVKAANLYTQEVFSRQTVFTICNEDTLAEFWEYYLLNNKKKCEALSDATRMLNSFGTLFIKRGLTTQIIAEESEDVLFFTIVDINRVPAAEIDEIMERNPQVNEYKRDRSRMSFMLPNTEEESYANARETFFAVDTPSEPVESAPSAKVELVKTSKSAVQTYEYFESEDLAEIEVYVGKLDSLFLLAGESDLAEEEANEIYTYLERIGKMMTIYSESYGIGQAIIGLSQDIASHSEMFRTHSSALAPMCAAFSRDLSCWIRMMFYEGAPSVDYMDDTIIANTQTISGMLKMNDAPADDDAGLDDIFDF